MLPVSWVPFVSLLALSVSNAQDIDLSSVLAAPSPVLVTPPLAVVSNKPTDLATTLAAAIPTDPPDPERRSVDIKARDGDCSPQPKGSGPAMSPDTVETFETSTVLQSMASNAQTPQDFYNIFTNLNGSVTASNYMGLYTLSSYNTSACAAICRSVSGCLAFNIYIERDPSLDANAQKCPNPPSTINYRCTVWGAPFTSAQATNTGQWRDSFQVAITASNGYGSRFAASTVSNFGPPVSFGNASINAPGGYMGYQYFPFSQSQGYTAQTCASYCIAQTTYNQAHAASDCSYVPCTFFDAYILSKNDQPQGLYCTIYNASYGPSYATNTASYDQDNNKYTVSQSYGYTLYNPPTQPAYSNQCGLPVVQDGNFDAPDLNSQPYLTPYWNFTTTGVSTASGGWGPGYGNSPRAFGATLYGSNPAPNVTLSQVVSFNSPAKRLYYYIQFWYKFDADMQADCRIGVNFPSGTQSYQYLKYGYQGWNFWKNIGLHQSSDPNTGVLALTFDCPGVSAPGGLILVDSIEIVPYT